MFLLQLIILLVIICGGLILALRHILTTNITSATSHLDELSAEFSKREEDIKKRQIEADKYYEEMTNLTKEEMNRIKQAGVSEVQAEKDKILEAARLQGEEIVSKAEKTKEMITNELRRELEEKNVDRLRGLFKDIFPDDVRPEVHKIWVEHLLKGDLLRLSHMRIPSDATDVKVVSIASLSAEQKNALKKKLKDELGREVVIHEELDPSLIGGLVISVGSIVLDGSIVYRVQQAMEQYE